MSRDDDYDEICGRLEAISEELSDRALAALRLALSDPDRRLAAAAEEKRIQRARRSIDKAAHLLAGSGATDE